MKLLKTSVPAIISICLLASCSEQPVPASECDKVVAHIKAVLKDKAPSSSKLSAECKAATDEQRGCVMGADKPMKILQCM
ncbi:hypothetical protein HR060_17475 [Catenovulum sp. SM1970]|uniref:hypothetical protein n=1 Tax=Marinifaba aquimaris TaxID=2741323 RepID=UPI001573884C|nr:hypothetical protein [Marinifaba aquimaris]NTS78637.1 hypothetical protein [Marinifaba aquimaris]